MNFLRRAAFVLFFAALLVQCASAPGNDLPVVAISQTSTVANLRVQMQGGLPVNYRLDITNPLDEPVTLRSIEIETVGTSGSYSLKRVKHSFEEMIPAGGNTSIELRAWVQPLQESTTGDVKSPVMLRGTAKFDATGRTLQSSFAGRVQ